MTELQRAIAEIKAARKPSLIAMNEIALREAVTRPILVANGVVSWLTGGQSDPNAVANTVGGYYSNAENNLVNSAGSPAAQQFIQLQNQALQPQFQQQQASLPGQLAAAGLTGSGAANNAVATLNGQQSGVLAGADAPLYQTALSQYGSLLGTGAGAQSGAYQSTNSQDLNSFYQALSAAAGAYGASSGGAPAAANPYAGSGGYSLGASGWGSNGWDQ